MKKIIVLACTAILLGACSGKKVNNTTEKTAIVKITEAKAADGIGERQFPCKVKAGSEISVAFKVAGTLRRVAVQEGQHVTVGQLLAEMDDTDYRVQLSATEAEYAQIKADAERVITLYEQGGTTASNYDKARYGLQQIESKLAHHRNQLAYCRIYAPQTGTIQSRMFDGGETLAAGMPVVQLVGNGRPEAEITVPANVQTMLAGVCKATATFNAMGERRYTLKLLHVLPKANANGMYPVRLAIEGTDLPSPGMNGWVTMTCADSSAHSNANVVIPSTAIIHSDKGDFIYKAVDGKAHKTSIKVLSLKGDGDAEISGDIAVGDKVVSSGAHHIANGQDIEILQEASPTNIGGLL